MDEYFNLKRKCGETAQAFSTRFNSVYDSIPIDIKPPPGIAMFHYSVGFDAEITYYPILYVIRTSMNKFVVI